MNQKLILVDNSASIYRTYIADHEPLNKIIIDKFSLYKDHQTNCKTHLFEGRYENIYISSELIPELHTVLTYSKLCVKKITGKNNLRSGLWFNDMQPGQVTLPHSHDDADEIYSAVYYLKIPVNSGDLIITENNSDFTITPIAGMLVLFPPQLQHHVTQNNSKHTRISLGINIGY